MKSIFTNLFSEQLPGLEKAMDLTFRRNQAITSNIANAETPGYRAVDVHFGQELDKAFGAHNEVLQKTNSLHMDVGSSSGAHLIPDLSGATKPDGNNVDVDVQMGQLTYNRSRYSQAANMVRKQFTVLSNAIRQVA